ncbi:MAG TPA: pilus assembly protein TadG-related protein [Dermatophilaceae bacterium]|nr:pilus assembly protein TadG-related protein [Dermatophilaceae bacterium]
MGLGRLQRRITAIRSGREQGSIIPLLSVLAVVVIVLVIGGIDVTAAHLARMRLYDTADAVALNAADAIDTSAFYHGTMAEAVVVSTATVRTTAQTDLDRRTRPANVTAWVLTPTTGSPDGTTAVVSLRGTVELPIITPFLAAIGSQVQITVESRARSELQ